MSLAILLKTRRFLLLAFAAAALWTVYVAAADPYRVKARPSGFRAGAGAGPFSQGPDRGLDEILSQARRRVMFKQSLIYEVKAAPTVNVLGDLSFLGVVQSGGRTRAVILNSKTNASTFYSEGDAIGDLTLKEIRDDRLVLEHGEELLELTR